MENNNNEIKEEAQQDITEIEPQEKNDVEVGKGDTADLSKLMQPKTLWIIFGAIATLIAVIFIVIFLIPKEHTHTLGDYVKEKEIFATCTEDGSYDRVYYCTDCGEEASRTPIKELALGHIGGEVSCTEGAVCTRCGVCYKPARGHIGYVATCTDRSVCFYCEEEYGELGEHDFSEGGNCKICGEKKSSVSEE